VGDQLRIGELGARLGLSTATLRYYESLGLLGEPDRSPRGYRLFSGDDEERVRFILRAKALDLSLDEIRSLLDLWREGGCGDTRASLRHLVAHKIREARARAQEADAFAAQLTHVYARLGEEVGTGPERCECIPDLPARDEVDLDTELARIEQSMCDCGAHLDEVPAAVERTCACGCCAPTGALVHLTTNPREEVTTS